MSSFSFSSFIVIIQWVVFFLNVALLYLFNFLTALEYKVQTFRASLFRSSATSAFFRPCSLRWLTAVSKILSLLSENAFIGMYIVFLLVLILVC